MSNLSDQIYQLLQIIPSGKVVTYGQISEVLGRPRAARAVGNILHQNIEPDLYPCYKVVSATGKLSCHYAFGGIAAQQARLERDHIVVQEGRVDLKRYQASSEDLAKLLAESSAHG